MSTYPQIDALDQARDRQDYLQGVLDEVHVEPPPPVKPEDPESPLERAPMNPFEFFALQLLMVLAWLCSLGSLTLTIAYQESLCMVLQGWAPWECCMLELEMDGEGPHD